MIVGMDDGKHSFGRVGEVSHDGRVAIVSECVVLYDGDGAVGKKLDCGRLDEVGVVSVVVVGKVGEVIYGRVAIVGECVDGKKNWSWKT